MADFRHSLRSLRRSPGFAFTAIVTLALGIAAITLLFSLVDAVLLRPLPFMEPDRLAWLYSRVASRPRALFTLAEFCDYRDRNRSFQRLAAVGSFNANLVDRGGDAERVQGVRISADAFAMLGVTPASGRLLAAADDLPQAPRVAVISHHLWQHRYGGDAAVVGTTVMLNGESYEIAGVLPRGFILPALDSEVAVPLKPESDPLRDERGAVNFLRLVGRLQEGVSLEQAHAEMDSLRENLRREHPVAYAQKIGIVAVPIAEELVGATRPILLLLFGAVAALLLIACTNLAGMLLARAIARQRELAIRAALGAGRGNLVTLLLGEGLIIAAVAGVVGTLLYWWSLDAVVALLPVELPRVRDVQPHAGIVAFTCAVALVVGLVFGGIPAWLMSRTVAGDALAGVRGVTAAPRAIGARRVLVVAQVALALTLLSITGLFLRSFWRVHHEGAGFDPANVLTVRFSLPQAQYPDRAALVHYVDQLAERFRRLPDAHDVGLVSALPLSRVLVTVPFSVADRPPVTAADTPSAQFRAITPASGAPSVFHFWAVGTSPMRTRPSDRRSH